MLLGALNSHVELEQEVFKRLKGAHTSIAELDLAWGIEVLRFARESMSVFLSFLIVV